MESIIYLIATFYECIAELSAAIKIDMNKIYLILMMKIIAL